MPTSENAAGSGMAVILTGVKEIFFNTIALGRVPLVPRRQQRQRELRTQSPLRSSVDPLGPNFAPTRPTGRQARYPDRVERRASDSSSCGRERQAEGNDGAVQLDDVRFRRRAPRRRHAFHWRRRRARVEWRRKPICDFWHVHEARWSAGLRLLLSRAISDQPEAC